MIQNVHVRRYIYIEHKLSHIGWCELYYDIRFDSFKMLVDTAFIRYDVRVDGTGERIYCLGRCNDVRYSDQFCTAISGSSDTVVTACILQ